MIREIEFHWQHNKIQGPIIDWCNRLTNTDVRSLELHSTHQTLGLSVIIILFNGLKYRLKRNVKPFRVPVPKFTDTIEDIRSSPLASALPDSYALVRVHFKAKYCPNLHNILVACYGAQTQRGFFRAPEIIADADFFALSITLNVARRCIYRRDPPSNSTSTAAITPPAESPLKLLWNSVYRSIQNEDYAFWGDAIAEHTKNITRELVYKVARKNIAGLLDSEKAQSISASLVSRVEVLVKKKEISEPTLWDEEWNKRWKETWSGSQQNFGLPADLNDSNKVFRLKVDGRAAGEIAGRTPTKTLMPECKILFNTIFGGMHSQGGTGCSDNTTGQEVEENIDPGMDNCLRFGAASRTPHAIKNRTTPRIWPGYCILGVQSQNGDFWALPREVAVEMAWEEAWDVAVFQGIEAARSIQKREQRTFQPRINPTPQEVSHITTSPRTSGKNPMKAALRKISGKASINDIPSTPSGRPIPPDIAIPHSSMRITALLSPPIPLDPDHERFFQWSVQERRYLEKKEESRTQAKRGVNNLRREIASMIKQKPGNGSEDAWAFLNPGSLIRPTLEELADRELQNFLAQVSQTNSQESLEWANDWKKKFTDTWERAWKRSWDAAWEAVWEETWNAAVARGVEFGAELILDDPTHDLKRGRYEQLRKEEPYTQVELILKQKTCLGTLEQVRVMMRELYLLYELLHHSVSDSRNDHLEILVSTEFNKSKMGFKSTRKVIAEDPPYPVSYSELQEWIEKYLINPKFGNSLNMDTHAQKLFKRGIAGVWGSSFGVEREEIPLSMPRQMH
ncbi:unnamed protein product [Rhizoctonia solani]|uniref:Uncharacterized protein n=1 Tax=Rhizoctonia solani TaxID=456999 RepID=A0A8H3ART1_9AGAM|nr:unnamed protein product [Rhizoctonia solani]